jgi:hypothetical protein
MSSLLTFGLPFFYLKFFYLKFEQTNVRLSAILSPNVNSKGSIGRTRSEMVNFLLQIEGFCWASTAVDITLVKPKYLGVDAY